MTTSELITQQFDHLVEGGRKVVQSCGWDGDNYRVKMPSESDYFRFRTEALNLIRRSCGEDSDHYKELRRLVESKQASTTCFYYAHCLGLLEAACNDFKAGLLFDMRALIAAELLGDLTEQAETLLAAGYHVAAASLAGAVLEDVLRKLCEKHHVPVPESTEIDRLNADLARATVYDKLVQKRITALADIRNNADHGHPDKFSKADVEDMVKWVRSFSADYLR